MPDQTQKKDVKPRQPRRRRTSKTAKPEVKSAAPQVKTAPETQCERCDGCKKCGPGAACSCCPDAASPEPPKPVEVERKPTVLLNPEGDLPEMQKIWREAPKVSSLPARVESESATPPSWWQRLLTWIGLR